MRQKVFAHVPTEYVEHSYNAWRFEDNRQTFKGIVRARNHTLATKKAQTFYGANAWVTARD